MTNKWVLEQARLEAEGRLVEVKIQRDLLLAALEAVEWIYAAHGDWVYCPWCKTEWYSNIPEHWVHDDNCQRQAAIALVVTKGDQ